MQSISDANTERLNLPTSKTFRPGPRGPPTPEERTSQAQNARQYAHLPDNDRYQERPRQGRPRLTNHRLKGTARSEGYYTVTEDGGIFAFGDSVYSGSTPEIDHP